ncbi:hypothetical protein MJD09_27980, partial [bacterium]|nr:hypothetical protein [bacterium]
MEVNKMDAKNHNWTATKYSIQVPENRFSLEYRPQIGIKEGSHHTGFSGLRFGLVNSDFGIASGYNLFLFPTSGIDETDEIRVKVINNTRQPIYLPWPKQNDYYYPSIRGKYKLETLLKSSIVWGDFSRTSFTFEDDAFEIHISNLVPEELRKDILDKTTTILTNLTRVFGATGSEKITIYFLPKTEDGYDIYTKNWSDQIATTMFPPTNSRWKKFTWKLLDVYLQHKPTRREIHEKEDYWLIDGLKYYYADKSLDWIERVNLNELVVSYENKMKSRMNSQSETILSERFDKKLNLSQFTNYKMKSTYVLNKFNDIILKSSNQKDSLDTFLPYYFKKNDRHNFTELLSKYLESRVPQEELQRYVAQRIFQRNFPPSEVNILSKQKDKMASSNAHTRTLKFLHIAEHYNYLENCGCKVNENGGIARLATVIKEKRDQNPELILLNLGDN